MKWWERHDVLCFGVIQSTDLDKVIVVLLLESFHL
jgi:hypothetical protein